MSSSTHNYNNSLKLFVQHMWDDYQLLREMTMNGEHNECLTTIYEIAKKKQFFHRLGIQFMQERACLGDKADPMKVCFYEIGSCL